MKSNASRTMLFAAMGFLASSTCASSALAESSGAQNAGAPQASGVNRAAEIKHLDINEYRIEGATLLAEADVDEVVYPFLGPDRTTDDVERARAALQKLYNDRGYQTVAVQIPPQTVKAGIVTLNVVEGKVGRLRVHGSRYYDIAKIKDQAGSLAEGSVPNFKNVQRDIVALNQEPDRRVTPGLRAGTTPGTVDVDLNVDDTLPLHASAEYNNRYSADTTKTRVTATMHYDNLWQLGHSLSFSYQVAPDRLSDTQVYSGSYLARIPGLDAVSFLVYGVKQDSNVSTIGNINVAGRGSIIGTRAILTLPYEDGFFHTISLGFDYKKFDENVTLSGETVPAPITYYPITADYTGTWQGTESLTQLNLATVFHLRGMGSRPSDFDNKRYKASGDFFLLRGYVSRTQEFFFNSELFAKVQGQISGSPLISSEEMSGGGLDTVRGYLESEVLGDSGVIGSFEIRSPYLPGLVGLKADKSFIDDWRLYGFVEGGMLSINEPLPNQKADFALGSVGGGTRLKLFHYLNGSADVGFPLVTQSQSRAWKARLSFRVWLEF